MKKIILGLAILMPCINLPGAPNQEATSSFSQRSDSLTSISMRKIKTLIAHDKKQVQLNIDGKYRIFDPHMKKHITTRFKGKNQIIESLHDGLKWGEEFPGLHQLEFVPGSPETTISIDGIPYKGNIYIYDIGGTISVVNELPVDDYLFSILAANQNKQSSGEVQAALVIAARTNIYYQILNPKSPFWDVDASTTGYKGMIAEDASPLLQKAIKNTKDIVLSLSGKFEGTLKPFPIEWESSIGDSKALKKAQKSLVSVVEANEMAKKGEHADVILKKAFPQASLHLVTNE